MQVLQVGLATPSVTVYTREVDVTCGETTLTVDNKGRGDEWRIGYYGGGFDDAPSGASFEEAITWARDKVFKIEQARLARLNLDYQLGQL